MKNKEVSVLSDYSISNNSSRNEDLARKFREAGQKKTNIQDFINDFIHQFISDQTKKAYLTDLAYFFNFLRSGDVIVRHPSDIQGHHFQFYRDHLIENKYSSATINRKLVAIRSFIKWAMACKLIDYNPLDIVKLPKVQTESPTLAFTDTEVLEMLNATDMNSKSGQIHHIAMVLLFSLGLRRSELVNIKIKDFYSDRNHHVVRIHGKGGKDRHLPLAPSIVRKLQNYVAYMGNLEADDYLIQNAKSQKNEKPLDGSSVYRMIEKYTKICGINKKVSPHSCRATAISHLLDTQKTPIRDVAIFAGHAKITTTERYDKRREGLDDSAAYNVDYTARKKTIGEN